MRTDIFSKKFSLTSSPQEASLLDRSDSDLILFLRPLLLQEVDLGKLQLLKQLQYLPHQVVRVSHQPHQLEYLDNLHRKGRRVCLSAKRSKSSGTSLSSSDNAASFPIQDITLTPRDSVSSPTLGAASTSVRLYSMRLQTTPQTVFSRAPSSSVT